MSQRRDINFTWDNGGHRPLKITRDPWAEGKPKTTLSLTTDEAKALAEFINSVID